MECVNYDSQTQSLVFLADYDRIFLEKPFTMDEIKDVVWGCGKDKCPGPNGFHSST